MFGQQECMSVSQKLLSKFRKDIINVITAVADIPVEDNHNHINSAGSPTDKNIRSFLLEYRCFVNENTLLIRLLIYPYVL